MRGLLLSGTAVASGMIYGRFVEPRLLDLSVTPVALPSGRLRKPLRILHLSDFHHSPFIGLPFIEKSIRLGLRSQPDLICLTGDFITRQLADGNAYLRLMAKLREAAPTFACFGNHDGGSWAALRGGYADPSAMESLLRRAGVTTLRNQASSVVIKGQPVEIVGLGDLWSNETNPSEAFPPGAPEGFRLVLAHNPDSKDLLAAHPWDLMLCGHTHGGQIRIPLIGTPFAPVKDPRYVAGLNSWRGRLLFTTRGVGNLHGVRFNCPPEVSILEVA